MRIHLKKVSMLMTGCFLFGGTHVSYAQTALFEADTITVNSTFTSPTFTSINFRQTYDKIPLVFVLPTTEGGDPSSLRIRNVTTTGFEIVQVEPDGNDGPHVAMTNVSYLAIEPGRHEIQTGVFLDAGRFQTTTTVQSTIFGSAGGYETVQFREDYSAAPAVLATIQTMNNETNAVPSTNSSPWLTAAVNNIQTGQFDISLERAEVDDGGVVNVDETIGYLALESTTGSFTDDGGATVLWDAFISSDSIVGFDDGSVNIGFNQTFGSTPIAVATQATRDGNNGGWLRQDGLNSSGIDLVVDEDLSNDTERNHTTERASIAAFSQAFDTTTNLENVTITWLGSTSNAWNENGNWTNWTGDDYNLIDGDILRFDDTGSATTNTFVADAYNTELGGLIFDQSTAYTLNAGGGSLIFEDGASITNDSSEQQTIAVDIAARGNQLTIDSGSTTGGSLVLDNNTNIDLSDTGGVALTVTGSNNTQISGTISGSGATLTKTGSGTLTLEGTVANTYDGTTTVDGGTLTLNKTAGVDAVAGDIVIDSGTLLLDANNQINDSSQLDLSGGTFATGGNDETLATLTLSASSIIDLGSGSSTIQFDDSSASSWTGGQTLSITNWSGSSTDQIFFGNSNTALSSSQIQQIVFINPAGYGPGTYTSLLLASGEIVPVPETGTLITGGLALGGILVHIVMRRRKLQSCSESVQFHLFGR